MSDSVPGRRVVALWGPTAMPDSSCQCRHVPSLHGIRRLLRLAHDHHSERSWTRLLPGLVAGDTLDEQLALTWVAAQDLRLIFACPDRPRAEQGVVPC